MATGAYVLNTDIFDVSGVEIAGKEYGLPQTILLQKDVHPIKVVKMKKWIPLNSPGDIQSAELQLKKKH